MKTGIFIAFGAIALIYFMIPKTPRKMRIPEDTVNDPRWKGAADFDD